MKPELDNALFSKYPQIFSGRYKSPMETPMAFGFECGDGWYWIIDNLCLTIQSYIDSNPHLNIPQVVATQVKEKYGTLRFYYYGGDELIGGMVWLAEHLSGHICEYCGTTDNIGMTEGWISTVCHPCLIKYNLGRKWNPLGTKAKER